jgi:hypothetical protein
LVDDNKLSLSAAEAVTRAPAEEKQRISGMTDDEAVAEAKRLARTSNSARTDEETPTSLIRPLNVFLGHWGKARDEARARLREWLHDEAQSAALGALKALAGPMEQT